MLTKVTRTGGVPTKIARMLWTTSMCNCVLVATWDYHANVMSLTSWSVLMWPRCSGTPNVKGVHVDGSQPAFPGKCVCKTCRCKGHFSRVMIVPHLAIAFRLGPMADDFCLLSSFLVPCPCSGAWSTSSSRSRDMYAHTCTYLHICIQLLCLDTCFSFAKELGCNLVYGLA